MIERPEGPVGIEPRPIAPKWRWAYLQPHRLPSVVLITGSIVVTGVAITVLITSSDGGRTLGLLFALSYALAGAAALYGGIVAPRDVRSWPWPVSPTKMRPHLVWSIWSMCSMGAFWLGLAAFSLADAVGEPPLALMAIGLPTILALGLIIAALVHHETMRHFKLAAERHRFCATCGYDMRGTDSPACPECGAS